MAGDDDFDLAAKGEAERERDPTLSTPQEVRYDPSEDRERKRGQIALSLVGMLAAIAAFSLIFVTVATSDRQAALKAVLELVFGPIVGLVGAVTGFHFGSDKSRP